MMITDIRLIAVRMTVVMKGFGGSSSTYLKDHENSEYNFKIQFSLG